MKNIVKHFKLVSLDHAQSKIGIIAKRSEASFTQEKNSEGKLTGLMMPKIGSRPSVVLMPHVQDSYRHSTNGATQVPF